MVEVQISYQGDLRCRARHMPSGDTLITDAPVDNMGKGQAFSPTDLVATGLGTCVLTIMGIVAQRHGIDLSGAGVRVRKEMVSDPVRRIGRLEVDITIPAPVGEKERTILERAVKVCPVHQSLHPDIQVLFQFHWAAAAAATT